MARCCSGSPASGVADGCSRCLKFPTLRSCDDTALCELISRELRGEDTVRVDSGAPWPLVGLTQAQVSKLENGKPELNLETLLHYAKVLHPPQHMVWFDFPGRSRLRPPRDPAGTPSRALGGGGIIAVTAGMAVLPDRIGVDDIATVRGSMAQLVALDNRFGGADLTRMSDPPLHGSASSGRRWLVRPGDPC
jgi:hypothetical protein